VRRRLASATAAIGSTQKGQFEGFETTRRGMGRAERPGTIRQMNSGDSLGPRIVTAAIDSTMRRSG
jgi:hypothetical protein